jgi:hypothetical protein
MTTKPVKLSEKQKKFIIDYLLCFSKGIVESSEFWEGISQEEIDNNYDEWQDEIVGFIEETKHHLETTIGTP